jgi:AraC-like DNA-binding protein
MPTQAATTEDAERRSLPHFSVDSGVIGRAAAYALWRQARMALFEPYEDTPEFIDNFDVQLSIYNAGSMLFGRGLIMPQRFKRTPRQIAADGIESYFVIMCQSGGFKGTSEGVPITIAAGDAAIFSYNCARDFVAERSECLAVALPRTSLAPALADPDGVNGVVVRSGSSLSSLLFNHVEGLLEHAHEISVSDAAALTRCTAAMIAVCFGPAAERKPELTAQIQAASLVAIKRYIDQHLADPRLSAERLQNVFNLSRTSIYRMFEPLGGIAKFIQRRRLRRTLIDLSAQECSHLSIDAIAQNLGFRGRANFARAFKAQFGVTPSDVRRNPSAGSEALAKLDRGAISPVAEWLSELG